METSPTGSDSQGMPFVGRQFLLEQLQNAFLAVRSGVATNVLIEGSRGVGKSALVQHFLATLGSPSEAIVLVGRCDQSELVPYAAFDEIIENLVACLALLPLSTTDELFVPDIFSLTRVFPKLRSIKTLAQAIREHQSVPDQQELRRRAFWSLRDLLCRIGIKLPLVLAIENLQWCDPDSQLLLKELLRSPDGPKALVIGTFRSEQKDAPFLATLLNAKDDLDTRVSWQKLSVEPLSADEARRLVISFAGDTGIAEAERGLIINESHGNPFLIRELVQYLQSGGRSASTLATEAQNRLPSESSPNVASEPLVIQPDSMNDPAGSCQDYRMAAEAASKRLAFDCAARLYELAIGIGPVSDSELRRLQVQRGDALASAGKGREAAQAYIAAANGPAATDKLELHRRAAELFLISGHVDEGLVSLRIVLELSGLNYPSTPLRALIRLLRYRLKLRLRGIGYTQRGASQVSSEELARIDTCWTVSVGLSMIDPIRASCFMSYGLLLALKAGEPYRIARGLAMESVLQSADGARGKHPIDAMLQRSDAIATELNSPHASAMASLARGWIGYLTGDFRECLKHCEISEKIFRDSCSGVSWELDTAQIYQIYSYSWLGDFGQFRLRLTEFLREANSRGDLYAERTMSAPLVDLYLIVDDDLAAARRSVNESTQRRSHLGFHVQHFSNFNSELHFYLYSQNAQAAWNVACERRAGLKSSLLVRVQFIRIWTAYLCGLGALAAASNDKRLLREAGREVSQLLSERVAWAKPFAVQIQAGIAWHKGEGEKAEKLLAAAASEFDDIGLAIYAAASRRRLGEIIGGQEGKQLVLESELAMKTMGVKNPESASRIFSPSLGAR